MYRFSSLFLFTIGLTTGAQARDVAKPEVVILEITVDDQDEHSVSVDSYTAGGAHLSSSEVAIGHEQSEFFTVADNGCVDGESCAGSRDWPLDELMIIVETYTVNPTSSRAIEGVTQGRIAIGWDQGEVLPQERSVRINDETAMSIQVVPTNDWVSISPIPTPTP